MDADKAKQYAFRLLGFRQRSRSEIADRLKKKGVKADVIHMVIRTLERTGCLDDERFARDFIESRIESRPAGRKYFKTELVKKLVAEETVEKVLEDILPPEKEYEAAYNAGLKVFSRHSGLNEEARFKKVYGYLIRRGFPGDAAGEILEKLAAEYRENEN